ncbi:MAG TPA: hypothetical protein VH137_05345, partial [Gemmatimonadales bacterium]|nr:hypothetical protein [Gemmatimonadales bacterium]
MKLHRAQRTFLIALKRLVQPPLLGAVYMVALAVRAAQTPSADPRDLGAQGREIEAVVEGRFGHEIGRIGVAVVATAVVVGLFLGAVATSLADLRADLHPAPRTPWLRWLEVLAVTIALHAGLELWAMAQDPQLYASAWYARGGWPRAVQVVATDVLGPRGVLLVGVTVVGVFLAGPANQWRRLPDRGRHALRRLRVRTSRVFAVAAAGMVLVAALALSRMPSAKAQASADDARPNILVLAADSLRADRLQPRTAPHLSALAEQGTRFERAYVSLPRTFP